MEGNLHASIFAIVIDPLNKQRQNPRLLLRRQRSPHRIEFTERGRNLVLGYVVGHQPGDLFPDLSNTSLLRQIAFLDLGHSRQFAVLGATGGDLAQFRLVRPTLAF